MTVRKPHIIIFLLMVLAVFCAESLRAGRKRWKRMIISMCLSANMDYLVVRMRKGINLYDGKLFLFVPLLDEKAQILSKP